MNSTINLIRALNNIENDITHLTYEEWQCEDPAELRVLRWQIHELIEEKNRITSEIQAINYLHSGE